MVICKIAQWLWGIRPSNYVHIQGCIFWMCFGVSSIISSHLERAERMHCPAFPITYMNFRIFFQWKILTVSRDDMFVYICLLCCKITTQLCFHDLQHHLQVTNRNASSIGSRQNYRSEVRSNNLAFWGSVPVVFITLVHTGLLLRCLFIQKAFSFAF